ncbi:hypothetical protein V8D89_014384 [Ganoderma adspersum]
MKTYLPPVDTDGFNAVYSAEMIERIHDTFSTAVNISSDNDHLVKERIISKHSVHKNETLCPGYLLNISETDADDLVDEHRSNYMLGDLGIEFKRGGTENDAWDNLPNKSIEADAYSRTGVRGPLMSYSKCFFFSQHRTGLFMLLVNGGEFRVVRWDRSGCIVTEVLSYVDTAEHTKKLLQFFYAFSKMTLVQRGVNPTATRLSNDSCGWRWMQKVAVAHPQDIDHTEGTVAQSVPPGFIVKPARDAPPSRLLATNMLSSDPAATTGFGDLSSSSATSAIIPVFKYVRDFFRESVSNTLLPYRLKVCGRDCLIGEPIFGPHGLVGHGTHRYVALEWETQGLVFLKDAWRPFYEGVAQEGTTLGDLNHAEVPFVSTLICHEDVGDPGAQETEASQYSSTGGKRRDIFGDRPIAPMPTSRPKASGSCASTTRTRQSSQGSDGAPQPSTSSGSNGKGSAKSTKASKAGQGSDGRGGRSGKCSRPQDTAPMAPKDGFGLRHLTHYRIIVAEVCLTSTNITSGEQVMQIIWNCMSAHREAVVKCGILHRDVSSRNILILLEVIFPDSETGDSGGVVLWWGVLSDWELAKALPKGTAAITKARQPHRTGTWYYMSVYSLTFPGHPVSIADELESFFHVLLYLAIRFLRTNLSNAGAFVDSYFDAFKLDSDNRAVCGLLKDKIIQTGSLVWNTKPIRFFSDAPPGQSDRSLQQQDDSDSTRLSPLNDTIAKLLAYFKARYAVLDYERQVSVELSRPIPSLQSAIEAATSSAAAEAAAAAEARTKELRRAHLKAKGVGRSTKKDVNPEPSTPSLPVLEKPSQSVYDTAAKLPSHDGILDLLANEIDGKIWPKDDYAGDRLDGYVPRQLQSTTKRIRLQMQGTMQSIPGGEEGRERA